ncbi:MAG: hypothetical protein OXB90_05820 [Acidimicrobiaceae bacterium]|nr:hypothetical protein [Acidimicrobiaceae bacterium]
MQNTEEVTNEWWSDLPDIETGPRREGDVRGRQPGRRQFNKGVAVLIGGIAFGIFETISRFRLNIASAERGTEYFDCAGYANYAGYDDNSAPCVGFPYSSFYCGPDGWFRNSGEWGKGYYYRPVMACGEGMTKKNAWRWTHNGKQYRCADGIFCYRLFGSWVCTYKICSKQNP